MLFSKLNARSELVRNTFGRHTWKSEHANCTISETGTYPTKMAHQESLEMIAPPRSSIATNTEKVIQVCDVCAYEDFFCHQFYTFSALGRRDATFGKHYRLLENDSTDAISFNSAISACEKHLAKGSIGTVSRCRGPEDLDLERLLYAFISPPKHLFFWEPSICLTLRCFWAPRWAVF